MAATDYDESIASLLYPGNTLSQSVLQQALWASEAVLPTLGPYPTWYCLRLDAGFGTDANLRWAVRRGYQVVAKNNSGRRAGAWGQGIPDWQEIEPGRRWVGSPQEQLDLGAPSRTLVLRWRDERQQCFKHALYVVTDLSSPLPELCHRYDLRGGAEIEIRDDKQGLLLTHRRKRRWPAQETLILLNDLAHNFLSMFRYRVLQDTPLAAYGPYRLIQEVLSIPGEVRIDQDHLVEVCLQETHPWAPVLVEVLPRLWR